MPSLNVANVIDRTEAEGPGARFAVWVQGCPLRCRACCNPEQLAFVERNAVTPEALAERALRAGVEGVSLLGGEPMAQAMELARFASLVRAGGLSVMVFTGYTREELGAMEDEGVRALLASTDLLVDGRYEASLRSSTRRWVGSTNQQMYFLTDRYRADDPCFTQPNTVEIHLRDGEVVINGWPIEGAMTGRSIAGGAR